MTLHFKLIPVIDIMGGLAVRACSGHRDHYAPLVSRLCPSSDPIALARRLRTEYGAETLYIADLDAITGDGDNQLILRSIAEALPDLDLWIDAGLGDQASLDRFLRRCLGRPVIGSETLVASDLLSVAPDAVLSLDYQGTRLLGPDDLLRCTDHRPRDLILMSLHRVGTSLGPDLELLADIMRMLPQCHPYVAGGIRDTADLDRLESAGAAGVLLASALHDGRISASTTARYSN